MAAGDHRIANEAAIHLRGTVTYTAQQGLQASDFWLQVASGNNIYYCGTDATTVDCLPVADFASQRLQELLQLCGRPD